MAIFSKKKGFAQRRLYGLRLLKPSPLYSRLCYAWVAQFAQNAPNWDIFSD